MKPTLKDIADHTGLSISTVSRVLSGKSKRNTTNVVEIIEAAQRLNYPIYTDSTHVIDKKKNIFVGLITHFHVGEFYSSLYDGFNSAVKDTNYQIGLFHTELELSKVIEKINLLAFNSCDAVILFLPTLTESDYEKIITHTPPNLALISAATVHNPVLDTVTFDSYRGGHQIGKHFYNKGYKDVGIVLGTTIRNESLLRKSGFTDFVQHHSDMKLTWQCEGDYTIESGRRVYEDFRALEKKPRAIFFSNDYMCLGFLEQAQKEGFKIPEDLAVAGFDDLPICSYHFPSITSVSTDYAQLGKSALDLLTEKFQDTSNHQGLLRIVPVTLSAKGSS